MYSGGTSFMPLRVNYAGVMPVIFASAILMFPQKLFLMVSGAFKPQDGGFAKFVSETAGFHAPDSKPGLGGVSCVVWPHDFVFLLLLGGDAI